jgi:hypothetical protein
VTVVLNMTVLVAMGLSNNGCGKEPYKDCGLHGDGCVE